MSHDIRMKAGPLRNGAERGHGSVWHAIEGQFYDNAPALCGQRPRIMWSDWQPNDRKVTCPRCLKKLPAHSSQEGQK